MDVKISDEFKNRLEIWHQLKEKADIQNVEPAQLLHGKFKIIVGGQGPTRGIYRDMKRTSSMSLDDAGITISLLDLGVYKNFVRDDGAIYYYPETKLKNYDLKDIEATKNAKKFGLPIFYIRTSEFNKKNMDVRIGYVKDYDNERFFIKFGENLSESDDLQQPDDSDDDIFEPNEKQPSSPRIKRDAEFRYKVTNAYGNKCGVCSITLDSMLSAAHIVPKKYNGKDKAENGLVLCNNHHGAYDACQFSIEPETYRIIYQSSGPKRDELKIETEFFSSLSLNRPNKKYLTWRHEKFLKSTKSKN